MPNGGKYLREYKFTFEAFQETMDLFFLGHLLINAGFDLLKPISRKIEFDTKDFIFEQEIE
jgi:hypothetical protein